MLQIVRGRIKNIREVGAKLIFVDVISHFPNPNSSQQIMFKSPSFPISLRSGNLIEIQGFPVKTSSGIPTLQAESFKLLAECNRQIPWQWGLSKEQGLQRSCSQRHVDLIVNGESARKFTIRSKIIHWIRNWLHEKHFIEVETPILQACKSGGANARHFAVKSGGFLRIAPELALKRCIIAGMERVFEIGKQFRDEGSDKSHNPEFTSIEAYWAFASVDDLFGEMEEMLSEICKMLFNGECQAFEIDFTPPFPRIDVTKEIEGLFGGKSIDSLTLEDCKAKLPQNLPNPPQNLSNALDKLIEIYVESKTLTIGKPVFLTGHPRILAPLAKTDSVKGLKSARFELFICGIELVNAYSEQNDPQEQAKWLPEEAEFCEALQFGMPETAGWGMGIDRLVMIFTGSEHIRDVILFGWK